MEQYTEKDYRADLRDLMSKLDIRYDSAEGYYYDREDDWNIIRYKAFETTLKDAVKDHYPEKVLFQWAMMHVADMRTDERKADVALKCEEFYESFLTGEEQELFPEPARNLEGRGYGTISVANVREFGGPEGFEKASAHNVYIGRRPQGNVLGNPFTHLQGKETLAQYVVSSREEAVIRYSEYFDAKYGTDPHYTLAINTLYDRVASGESITLGCWCKPLACHGDIIKEKLELMLEKGTKQTMSGQSSSERKQEPETNAPIVFIEDDSPYYKTRTQRNADAADMTIAIAIDYETAGEKCTRNCAGDKYIRMQFPTNGGHIGWEMAIRTALARGTFKAGQTIDLNIAGNGIYTLNEHGVTQEQADRVALDAVKKLQERFTIKSIRSGGQTGIDEAGIKAAVTLGIPATVLAPKGWKFRTADGQDVSDETAFKARFNLQEKKSVTTGKNQDDTAFHAKAEKALASGIFSEVGELKDGWARVRHSGGLYNYAGPDGKFMTKNWFKDATEFSGGKARVVCTDMTVCTIDCKGTILEVKEPPKKTITVK